MTDPALRERARRRSLPAAALFLAAFGLFFRRGGERRRYGADPATGTVSLVEGQAAPQPAPDAPRGGPLRRAASPPLAWGVAAGARGSRRALWASGAGSVATVLALLLAAGWNDTAYHPRCPTCSRRSRSCNSSSSRFTLRVMVRRVAPAAGRRGLRRLRMACGGAPAPAPRRGIERGPRTMCGPADAFPARAGYSPSPKGRRFWHTSSKARPFS